ncbi:F0F1 ATP synthase subunit delta [Acidimangrovimonas pyrenivorans]|uniref:ATP synthase subunit b n=1 Tax=Acidimangrovimonas pyrenivorans TaxID=2030798 RepID=A0ABV7ABL1_9RHOB
MEIDWWTLGFQAVNFAVLVWLLRRFLYAPVRRVIEARRAEAGAALERAEEARAAAEAERQGLVEDRVALENERVGVLTAARDEAAKERKALLERARAEAEEVLKIGREVLAEDRRAAIAGAEAELADLARTLARRILREASEGSLLEHVCARVAALPEEERTRLDAALEVKGAEIRVLTARPLTDGEQGQWRARLAAEFDGARVAFEVDPEILGGAELHFPHSALKYSWAEQLNQATEAIESDERV